MSNKYFITGLPRSRTAWMANLLTFGDSFCYHDAMLGLDRVEQLKERIDNAPFRHVGISDPANLCYWRKLREWYPKAKWVVIWRDFESASEASASAFGVKLQSGIQFQLKTLLRETGAMLVSFNNVSARCDEIAEYCGVDIGSEQRVFQLLRMNIQVDPKWLQDGLSELEKNPPQWLKELEMKGT